MKSRSLSVVVSLLCLLFLAPLAPGCGGDSGPSPSDKKPEELRQEQENMLRKEYGPGVNKVKKR